MEMAYSNKLRKNSMLWLCIATVLSCSHGIPTLNDNIGKKFYRGVVQKDCNGVNYDPAKESCCSEKKYSIPENTDAQCCGDVAYWRNEAKPADCLRQCGQRNFHQETELCCKGRVKWVGRDGQEQCCGDAFISTKELCCGGRYHLPSGSGLECCGLSKDMENALPYDKSTMTCKVQPPSDGSNDLNSPATSEPKVTLRRKNKFSTQDICNKTVLDMGRYSPNITALRGEWYNHVRGFVTCGVVVRKRFIVVPFYPFFTGSFIPDKCARAKNLTLRLKRKNTRAPCGADSLKKDWEGKTVDIFYGKKLSLRCNAKGELSLRLKDNYTAVILLSDVDNRLL